MGIFQIRNCKRLHRIFRNILLLSFLILVYAQNMAQAQNEVVYRIPQGVKSVRIPFENHNNLIIIPVVLGKGLHTKFILDSGANRSVLIEKLIADVLGWEYSREMVAGGAGGQGVIRAFQSDCVPITIKGIEAYPSEIIVLQEDYLQLREFLGIEVQGIIGSRVFRDLIVEIDYIRNEIVLHNPERFVLPKGYRAIDLEIKNNKPYIQGVFSVAGESRSAASFLVDLGASHALLLETDSLADIQLPEKRITTSLGRGLSGDIHGAVARVKEMKMDVFLLSDVLTSFAPEYSKIPFHDRAGTIGGEFFSRFHVIFDYGNEKLYLKKSRSFEEPFEYNMSGMEIRAFGQDFHRVVIDEVYAGSSADVAGLLPGDEIIKVNWFNVGSVSMSHINAVMRSRENRKIRIKILRKGKKMKFKFTLKRMI